MATYLIDKSAYARSHIPAVDAVVGPKLEAGEIAVTGISLLEILFSARSKLDHERHRVELSAFTRVALTERIIDRAIDVQQLMAERGIHRAASPADLILAACADANGLTILHYDKDFDLIAEVTQQPTEWVVPPGSV